MLLSRLLCAVTLLAGRAETLLVVVVVLTAGHFGMTPDRLNLSISDVSLVMLFVIQHSQNRDMLALQAKLDELVRAVPEARNELAGAEKRTEAEIAALGAAGHGT